MKLMYALSVLLALLAKISPVFFASGKNNTEPEIAPTENSGEPVRETPYASPAGIDEGVPVCLISADSEQTLSMREYLVGVLAAEMPALFEAEALKAQAVAARTFTLYRMLCSEAHDGGKVCDDYSCCQARKTTEELQGIWGGEYEANMAKISAAVAATDGLCLTSGGKPILAAFHSSSAGSTEACGEIWGASLPYLISVPTFEGEQEVPNYVTEVALPFTQFKNTVFAAYPDAVFADEPSGWLSQAEYTSSGRVAAVRVGGVKITGTELRVLFGLRSTYVSWGETDSEIVFHVTGNGHGVGMSQYGANAMAKRGSSCGEILAHYYPGAELSDMTAAAGDGEHI